MMRPGILPLVCALAVGGCGGTGSAREREPGAETSQLSDLVGARDALPACPPGNDGGDAPGPGLARTETRTKPERLVGGESNQYAASDQLVAVSCPVVALENVVYAIAVSNAATGFHREGKVNAQGKITEASLGG